MWSISEKGSAGVELHEARKPQVVGALYILEALVARAKSGI